LSTLPIQTGPAPAWKEEVNRRLALHKSRVASSSDAETTAAQQAAQRESSGRARQATAAARVAARYAKAPSYSEMLADEARAAVRAAEAASVAALRAQAAAESILAGLEAGLEAGLQAGLEADFAADRQAESVSGHDFSRAASAFESARALAPAATNHPAGDASPLSRQIAQSRSPGISWVADVPVLTREPAASLAPHETSATGIALEDDWEPQVWPPELALRAAINSLGNSIKLAGSG